MKRTMFLIAFVLASSVAALASSPLAGEGFKTCAFKMYVPGQDVGVPTVIQITKIDSRLVAKIRQSVHGRVIEFSHENTNISEFSVHENLQATTKKLNTAESIIRQTQMILDDPDNEGVISVRFNLSLIRSAKLYQIGKFSLTDMEGAVIVEARDAFGQELGSFLTGFTITDCGGPQT
mgnify:CR=1 FL=1